MPVRQRTHRWLVVMAILLPMVMFINCGQVDHTAEIDRRMSLAGELRDTKLYAAAVEEYEDVLKYDDLELKVRANTHYLIAKTCFENLYDYEKAAAHYIRARSLAPEASFSADLSRNLVASLEKSGRRLDARRELDQITELGEGPSGPDDPPVARISGSPIYRSEIERLIDRLPPERRSQMSSREARVNFVRQYVGNELLYRAALREKYDEDEQVKMQQEQLVKQLVVEKYVRDKVLPQLPPIDTIDVRNYYEAHKADQFGDAPFDSVRRQVEMQYRTEKTEAVYTEYIAKLAESEKVELLLQNVE